MKKEIYYCPNCDKKYKQKEIIIERNYINVPFSEDDLHLEVDLEFLCPNCKQELGLVRNSFFDDWEWDKPLIVDIWEENLLPNVKKDRKNSWLKIVYGVNDKEKDEKSFLGKYISYSEFKSWNEYDILIECLCLIEKEKPKKIYRILGFYYGNFNFPHIKGYQEVEDKENWAELLKPKVKELLRDTKELKPPKRKLKRR